MPKFEQFNQKKSFSKKLATWYSQNKRDLPWRHTNNPYLIWLSETILQQTRVEQGLPYYLRFTQHYPRVEDLANADQNEVLKLWQGLGYYSRARNLHTAAKDIADQYKGGFPDQHKDVLHIKGVGDYTAAAIMSFAYNKPYATVDGNVYRVLSRIFGVDEYIDTATGKKTFSALADELLDKDEPGLYNQAIMDFGATQCTPKSPDCQLCPFIAECIAYKGDLIKTLPRKKGKTKVRERFFSYFDIHVDDDIFLNRRKEGDIWQGLYEFPLIETQIKKSFEELINTEEYRALFSEQETIIIEERIEVKHILSHQIIYATFYKIRMENFSSLQYIRINKGDIEKFGVPRLIDKYLSEH